MFALNGTNQVAFSLGVFWSWAEFSEVCWGKME